MSSVSYVLEFSINDGQLDAFKAIAQDYAASTEANEPGTLRYRWYLNADGTKCILSETFASSEACLAHLGNVGPTLPNLLALAPVTRFEFLGEPSDELRGALADLQPVYFDTLAGFDR
jgi:quinol monooxygenase YgiN